jgi:hypothetical protein
MKDDYLWDKTGKDAEIEKLEASLSAFQYKPVVAPSLPSPEIETRTTGLWRLRLVLIPAFAAVLIGTVVVFLWRQTAPREVAADRTPVSQSVPEVIGGPSVTAVNKGPAVSLAGTTSMPRKRVRAREQKKVALHVRRYAAVTKLTREEKDAYDRLMLALAITSSKLRLVQDKVNGTELEKTGTSNRDK